MSSLSKCPHCYGVIEIGVTRCRHCAGDLSDAKIQEGIQALAVRASPGQVVCAACGSPGKPAKRKGGYAVIEVLLWILGIFVMHPIAIAAFIYTVYRFASAAKFCRSCGESL